MRSLAFASDLHFEFCDPPLEAEELLLERCFFPLERGDLLLDATVLCFLEIEMPLPE
jgi:hypothetical protein